MLTERGCIQYDAFKEGHSEIVRLLLNRKNGKMTKQSQRKLKNVKAANPNLTNNVGQSPLWIAASEGNVQCMRHLIDSGADVNAVIGSPNSKSMKHYHPGGLVMNQSIDVDKEGYTPLFIASENGHDDAVDMLLNLPSNIATNIDINAIRAKDGATPLIVAATKGHSNIVGKLLEKGAHPTISTDNEMNVLLEAAAKGEVEVIQVLYEYLVTVWAPKGITDFVNTGDFEGMTPLHLACIGGYEDTVKYLVETMNVDLFRRNMMGKSALNEADRNGHKSIAKWLSTQRVFMLLSFESQFQDCTRCLIAGFAKSISLTSSMESIYSISNEILKRIFDYFYDESTDKSLLLKATRYGYHRLAIKWWPSFENDTTKNGQNALKLAISLGHEMTARGLVALGANIDERDKNGRTALQVAAKSNDIETVRLLIACGANVNAMGKDSMSPLMMACAQGHYHVVQMLINEGKADVNMANSYGRTALHIAVNHNRANIVMLLLKHEVS